MLVHERIRDLIDARGLKYVAVAESVGMNKDWISTRLTGKVQILAEELALFGSALEVDPCVFLKDQPPSSQRIAVPNSIVESFENEGIGQMLIDYEALQALAPHEAAIVADLIASLHRNRANPAQ